MCAGVFVCVTDVTGTISGTYSINTFVVRLQSLWVNGTYAAWVPQGLWMQCHLCRLVCLSIYRAASGVMLPEIPSILGVTPCTCQRQSHVMVISVVTDTLLVFSVSFSPGVNTSMTAFLCILSLQWDQRKLSVFG